MTEVPKIVHDRLRTASSGISPHPEPDLLTAFSEQALSGPERETVLQHLSLCEDCRQLLTLSLPPEELATARLAPETSPRASSPSPASRFETKTRGRGLAGFFPPGFQWAALAAGIIVAGAVLLLRPEHPGIPSSASAPVTTANAPLPSTPQAPASATARLEIAPSSVETQSSPEELKKSSSAMLSPRPRSAPGIAENTGIAENKVALDKWTADRADRKESLSYSVNNLSAVPTPSEMKDKDKASSPPSSVTVAVAGAPAFGPGTTGALVARNDAPAIQKAKPALPQMETNEALNSPPATTSRAAKSAVLSNEDSNKLVAADKQFLTPNLWWKLADGALQRSSDNGQNWRSVLQADSPVLSYANSILEVWAGGKAGTLFHSTDGGLTWTRIRPSITAQSLSADVTHIEMHGSMEVILTTTTNEVWTSVDGGYLWQMKIREMK